MFKTSPVLFVDSCLSNAARMPFSGRPGSGQSSDPIGGQDCGLLVYMLIFNDSVCQEAEVRETFGIMLGQNLSSLINL